MRKALNSGKKQGTSQKILITGVSGFVGSHLVQLLLNKKVKVFGVTHPKHQSTNLEKFKNKIELVKCNLLNEKDVNSIVKSVNPDLVFHLAALASAAASFNNPSFTLKNNIEGQIFLLESLVKIKSRARILIVGSAEEYGTVTKSDLPIDEQTPLNPASPYAVSKVAQDLLGYQYFLHHHLNIVRVRPFNHIGPGQSADFAVSSFAAQIAQIENKGEGDIIVGNLNSWRDFTDVRDIVKAYILALSGRCVFGDVYNVGSGKAYKIADILDKMVRQSKAKIKIVIDKKRFRPLDAGKIYCDYSKFKKATGWQPTIPLVKTLSDTIDYERIKAHIEH